MSCKITGNWRTVPRYPAYLVSEDGDVYSLVRGETLSLTPTTAGYPTVAFGRRSPTYYVHRLVCHAFFGPCPQGMVVDHIDGDRSNNKLSNLRYIPKSENDAQCWRGKLKKHSRLDAAKILAIYALRGTKMSAHEVATMYGIRSTTTIHNIWLGKQWFNVTGATRCSPKTTKHGR